MKAPTSTAPDFELIVGKPRESFRWNVHAYPHELAKWHYHPEYELHLIQATSGTMFVGNHVSGFEPGILVLTGPNLPHNWVSDIAGGVHIPDRDMLIQFSDEFARGALASFPELQGIATLLDEARFGVRFGGETARRGARDLRRIGRLSGARRLALFIELLDELSRSEEREALSTRVYSTADNDAASDMLYDVLRFLAEHVTDDFRLADLSSRCGMSDAVFSRYFKRMTGHGFVRYVNRMRIHRACDQLAQTERPVTDICFAMGFNTLSSFNRQFRQVCGLTPSSYRHEARRNMRKSVELFMSDEIDKREAATAAGAHGLRAMKAGGLVQGHPG